MCWNHLTRRIESGGTYQYMLEVIYVWHCIARWANTNSCWYGWVTCQAIAWKHTRSLKKLLWLNLRKSIQIHLELPWHSIQTILLCQVVNTRVVKSISTSRSSCVHCFQFFVSFSPFKKCLPFTICKRAWLLLVCALVYCGKWWWWRSVCG